MDLIICEHNLFYHPQCQVYANLCLSLALVQFTAYQTRIFQMLL